VKKILATGVAAMGFLLVGPTPAHAAPRPPAAGDAQLTCARWNAGGWNPAYTCYDRKYDNFWVYDGDADGNSAVARWVTATGEHSGSCRNAKGAGTWQRCDENLPEYRPNGNRNTVRWDEWRYDSTYDSWQLLTAPAGTSAT
jgi:hypothetical protein